MDGVQLWCAGPYQPGGVRCEVDSGHFNLPSSDFNSSFKAGASVETQFGACIRHCRVIILLLHNAVIYHLGTHNATSASQ